MHLEIAGEPSLRQNLKGRSILVVDDEAVIRELCAKALKGYRILQAADGREALKVLDRNPVDVILTDVMMPNLSGLELLKAVKDHSPNQAVIVMTGYADKETILRALKADADDFISKPINLLQLKTTIDKVLEKTALKEELVHLKHMDRLKTDFLGLVSHKLKTPTTSISLFIQNLARDLEDNPDPDFRRTLEMIIEESQYLTYLIKDLLFYSEVLLKDEAPRPVEIDIREMAASVAGTLQDAFAKKGLTLEIDLRENYPKIRLDREHIFFALRALVENALKFSPPGAKVCLRAEVREDAVAVEVEDNGPGIPRDELPKVFEKFYQVDPENTGQVRGFGLGLFYARQFVQNHGGRIILQSEAGAGTTATLVLPRQ